MTATPPLRLVRGGESDGESDRESDRGDPVIENISTLEDGGRVDVRSDEVVSLSSDTAATSVASALSDGAPRPRSAARPRPGSAPRASTPRARPRSNPRTRTPMRRESPLLVTGRVDDVRIGARSGSVEIVDNNGTFAANENETAVRNIFNARRGRAVSIPEEDERADQSDAAAAAPRPAPRAAGHWLARAAAATNPRADRSTVPARSRRPAGPSDKQRPSHRKIRRWDNDRFVGTPSESTHVMLQEGEGEGGDLNWREHYMPHYPLEYRSEFAKLATNETKAGKSARDKFAKGEVARGVDGKREDSLESVVVAKFKKLGVTNDAGTDDMGKKLFRSLGPRIRSVVSRSCVPGDDDAPSFARRLVGAFESYLVSLALTGSKEDVAPGGYPPAQPRIVYDLFDKVFCAPPRVVIRTKRRQLTCRGKQLLPAAAVPAVHFYFSADDGDVNGGGEGRARSSAFCRILLHAVCQFHGLESSSSVFARDKNAKPGSDRGDGKRGGVKAVTVRGGALLAPDLKLLDYIDV